MKNYFKLSTIKPSSTELPSCFEIMSRIDDLAPSDANVSAIIHRLADGNYHTMIPVKATDSRFSTGLFIAEAKHHSLTASLKSAQAKMLKKLSKWKEQRFDVLV